jgi:vacuolar-type H+-ATPase subunit F/Vma7
MVKFYVVNPYHEKEMIAESEAQIIIVAMEIAKMLKAKIETWKDEDHFTCLDFGANNSYIKYKV